MIRAKGNQLLKKDILLESHQPELILSFLALNIERIQYIMGSTGIDQTRSAQGLRA